MSERGRRAGWVGGGEGQRHSKVRVWERGGGGGSADQER